MAIIYRDFRIYSKIMLL